MKLDNIKFSKLQHTQSLWVYELQINKLHITVIRSDKTGLYDLSVLSNHRNVMSGYKLSKDDVERELDFYISLSNRIQVPVNGQEPATILRQRRAARKTKKRNDL